MRYRGDCRAYVQGLIDRGDAMGPDYNGHALWPVSATYEPDAVGRRGYTIVEFTREPPAAALARFSEAVGLNVDGVQQLIAQLRSSNGAPS